MNPEPCGDGGHVCVWQAGQLSEEAYVEGRKKVMIAYNFVAGGEGNRSRTWYCTTSTGTTYGTVLA